MAKMEKITIGDVHVKSDLAESATRCIVLTMDAAPALEETSQSVCGIDGVGSVRLARFQGSLRKPHQAFPSFSFAVSRQ